MKKLWHGKKVKPSRTLGRSLFVVSNKLPLLEKGNPPFRDSKDVNLGSAFSGNVEESSLRIVRDCVDDT